MKLTACMCWYDEPVEFLERCVRSLAGIVDELVALDGAWYPFPDGSPHSPLEQQQAIRDAARDANIAHHLRPGSLWLSQIEKRDHALALAAGYGADWILVIDADEYLVAPAFDSNYSRAQVRDEITLALRTPGAAVATVTMRNVTGDDHPNLDQPWRRIFRAGTTITGWHNGYTLNGTTLAGDPPLAPAIDLTSILRIEHTPRSRSPQRNAAAKTYRHNRAQLGER